MNAVHSTDRISAILRARYPWAKKPDLLYHALCAVLSGREDTIPWETFTEEDRMHLEAMARGEQVSGLLYWTWKTEKPAYVPNKLLLHLFADYAKTEFQQKKCYQELTGRILPAMKGLGPVVILKGGALAHALYPHPALRPMNDLDILVPAQQQAEAVERLLAIDFVRAASQLGAANHELADRHHIKVVPQQAGSIPVEIHQVQALIHTTDASHDLPELQWFWDNLAPLTFPEHGSIQAWMLSPTAAILHLAVHLALQHGEADMPLLKYYDLHLIATYWKEQVDWSALLSQAKTAGRLAALCAAF